MDADAVAFQETLKMLRKFLAEFVAMMLFVFIGPGSACGVAGSSGWVLQVALTFGLAITVLAYTIGHISGGHINPAVTLGLCVAGLCPPMEGIIIFIAELLGALAGAALLMIAHDGKSDLTGSLATNQLAEGVSTGQAMCGEILMTFLLVYVVLESATSKWAAASRTMAPCAIGFAVFLAHSVLIPIDGCSINPARSWGPAMMQSTRAPAGQWSSYHWIFWIGPSLGAIFAALAFRVISPQYEEPAPEPEPEPEAGPDYEHMLELYRRYRRKTQELELLRQQMARRAWGETRQGDWHSTGESDFKSYEGAIAPATVEQLQAMIETTRDDIEAIDKEIHTVFASEGDIHGIVLRTADTGEFELAADTEVKKALPQHFEIVVDDDAPMKVQC